MKIFRGRFAKKVGLSRNRNVGFTIIELIVVIAVLGVLSTLAIPMFREFIASQRIKTASFDLMSLLTMTRSEAIKRNANATLSVDGSGNFVITAGGVTIQQREPFSGLTLTCKTGGATVACTDVIYTGSGRLQANVPSVEISGTGSSQLRCISIDLSGRPTSKKEGC